MATRHEDSELEWLPELAEFDADLWESRFDWEVARVRWARTQGFKHFKILPLIQAMTKRAAAGADTRPEESDD